MARAMWSGSLSFGLVNVPVALYSATQDKAIRFHQLQAGTADRVRNKRVNERTGDEVAYEDIVKGYDLGGGDYVVLTAEEVASVAPGASRTIDVGAFVDLADIDPIYFDRAYYVAPTKGGERAYALLRQAMLDANKVAVASFVMRDRQHLAAVRPREDALVLETLLYADEVRDPATEIDNLPVEAEFQPRELEMATMLIDTMTTSWEPEQYHDDFRQRLEDLIEQKRAGEVISVEAPAVQPAPVVDLLQALEASVRASRGDGGEGAAASGHGRTTGGGKGSGSRSAGGGRSATKGKAGARSGGSGRRGDDLSAMAKAELLRRAADLDITGRTRMTRDELEDAVRGASGGRRRKAS